MAFHYTHPAPGSGPPSPSLGGRPRRLFSSSSSSSPSSSGALPPTRASSNAFSSYLNFSPSHHAQSSSPIHQSISYRRRRSSSSAREGGRTGIALLSPFGGRGGSGGAGGQRGGSSSGGGHSGWAFPESSIREETMQEESSSPSRGRGINTLEVLGVNWEAETKEIDMDEARPSPSDSRRSYSTSSSSYHSSTATNRLFSTSNQTTTNPFLYGFPPSPTSSSSASRNDPGSSPTRTLSYPQSFISRRSTLLQSRAPTQSTFPNDSPAFSDASLPLEQDLMPSSPPASLQQRVEVPLPTGNETSSSWRPASSGQGGGGAAGGSGLGDALGLQMHEKTADLGGLELVKRRRGMTRQLEMEWREKWDGEVVGEEEMEEGGSRRDALGLELGKRKFDEIDDEDEDYSSPPSPRSSSSPATPEGRSHPLPVIKLVVRRFANQQREEEKDEELQPSTDSEEDKEDAGPSSSGNGSECSPSTNLRASRSKGKTSMRLLQDRRSPSPVDGSPESSSPSSSKRKRTSSSPSAVYPQTRQRTAFSSLSPVSPEKTMPSIPALPLNRTGSSATSSALSSLEPTPLFTIGPLPASAYSSLAAASSYPEPGSQNIDDDGGEEDLFEPIAPPSPAPSSPLSSAPPSPQPNVNLPLPSAVPAASSQSPQRRRPSVRNNNVVPSTRRTFKPNLKIEPGFDGWYRNFSIPTPLSSQVASALGLPAQDAPAPPRPMAASAKRNDGGRGPVDLYSPRWVQGMGTEKTALCPICFEDDGVTPVSFKTKCSAYNYHLLHVHGISPSTGLPFSPPMDFRSVKRSSARPDERKKIREGKCHECKNWIPVEGPKNINVLVPEIFYWKHARDCHKSRLAGDRDIWKPSATLDRITTWIDGLGDGEKSGWVVPSKHRTAAALAAAPAAAV